MTAPRIFRSGIFLYCTRTFPLGQRHDGVLGVARGMERLNHVPVQHNLLCPAQILGVKMSGAGMIDQLPMTADMIRMCVGLGDDIKAQPPGSDKFEHRFDGAPVNRHSGRLPVNQITQIIGSVAKLFDM